MALNIKDFENEDKMVNNNTQKYDGCFKAIINAIIGFSFWAFVIFFILKSCN